MSEIIYERIKENLLALNMKNTLKIIDNYLERAIADKINIVDVLDHILMQEAKAKKNRAVENQITMSGFPFRKTKAHFENRLAERIKNYAKYKVLIIDEIGYLPMDIQGSNLFFQLIVKRYKKNTTIFTSNKPFSQWNEIFSDVTIASAILDRILHLCNVINIKGESYMLKRTQIIYETKRKIQHTF